MLEIIQTITDKEVDYISRLDYNQESEIHRKELEALIHKQSGIVAEDQYWHPYEVVELCSHVLNPNHEREFVICTLIILLNVKNGTDHWSDLEFKLECRRTDYDSLSPSYREVVLNNYSMLIE